MLDQYCTLYIPTTLHDVPASVDKVDLIRVKVKTTLAKLFGGYTESVNNGGWYSDDLDKLIEERVYCVKAYAESIPRLSNNWNHLRDISKRN